MLPDVTSLSLFPNAAIGDEANNPFRSVFAIASVGIATLTMLKSLLPAAAYEVEHKSTKLSADFTKLVGYIRDSEIPPPHIMEVISSITVGMQFQDRNTQIMQNAASILVRYRSMLEEVCREIESARDMDVACAHAVSKAVDEILSSIHLSDVKTRYLEALNAAKIHSRGSAPAMAHEEPLANEIELF